MHYMYFTKWNVYCCTVYMIYIYTDVQYQGYCRSRLDGQASPCAGQVHLDSGKDRSQDVVPMLRDLNIGQQKTVCIQQRSIQFSIEFDEALLYVMYVYGHHI